MYESSSIAADTGEEKKQARCRRSKTLYYEETISLIKYACARILAYFHAFHQISQPHSRSKAKVLAITHLLQTSDYARLHLQFLYALHWTLTETVLREGFEDIQITAGPIEHIGDPILSVGWLFTSAKLPVEFRRAKLGLSVLLSPTRALLGLNFLPLQQLGLGVEGAWVPPGYADEAAVRCVEVKVGVGKVRSRGTLTLPAGEGRFPCVVMLSGSGPCDQDSSVGCAKPFKDLALGLAARGVASLRFDKITCTYGVRLRDKRSFTLEEEYMGHALDAADQAVQHESILSDSVFVLGHSLIAYVAPRVMATNPQVAGCIFMAGPAAPMCWSALRQLRYLASLDISATNVDELPQVKRLRRQCELSADPDLSLATPSSKLPLVIGPAYWRDFANFRPIETCTSGERPVLMLQGARDYQVTVEDDFALWRAGLEGKSFAKFEVYEGRYHLFIRGEGQPSPREYEEPGNVDERVVWDIGVWVSKGLYLRVSLRLDNVYSDISATLEASGADLELANTAVWAAQTSLRRLVGLYEEFCRYISGGLAPTGVEEKLLTAFMRSLRYGYVKDLSMEVTESGSLKPVFLHSLKPGDGEEKLAWATDFLSLNIAGYYAETGQDPDERGGLCTAHWVETDGGRHTLDVMTDEMSLVRSGHASPHFVVNPLRKDIIVDIFVARTCIRMLPSKLLPRPIDEIYPDEIKQLFFLTMAMDQGRETTVFDRGLVRDLDNWSLELLKRYLKATGEVSDEDLADSSLSDLRRSIQTLFNLCREGNEDSYELIKTVKRTDEPDQALDPDLFPGVAWEYNAVVLCAWYGVTGRSEPDATTETRERPPVVPGVERATAGWSRCISGWCGCHHVRHHRACLEAMSAYYRAFSFPSHFDV